MERYKIIFIAVGVVLGITCLVVFVLSSLVHVKSHLSPQERQLARYQYRKIEMNERRSVIYADLKNPLVPGRETGVSGKGYPSESLADLAPPGKEEKGAGREKTAGLSLVVIKDHLKMAVINGEVVKEGDRTRGGEVLKITRNGVLMKNKEGEQWINIE